MVEAVIYSRVSSEGQEKEGTSLQTQLDNCVKYCEEKGYEVAFRFSETYSGLSLERPELDKLRELVRSEAIDVLVCYSIDRLSRDPTHGVIITEELDKHGVKLEAVTEDVSNTELGKLITYIRGFAAKLEAQKIKERTVRGKRAKAKLGQMVIGSGVGLYGYDYVNVAQDNGGRRFINENEAKNVRDIYSWLVNDGLSINAIVYRLRANNVPTKSGKNWHRRSVHAVLTNPAYTGKTYAFTMTAKTSRFSRPQSDWIEIEGVTPVIIDQDIFDKAQKQFKENQDKCIRNCKHEYLLRGRIRCRKCGRAYVGRIARSSHNGKRDERRYYSCTGKLKMNAPVDRCCNKGWSADKLERMVWNELECYLSNPDRIIAKLEAQRQDASQLEIHEAELDRIGRQLKAVEREQHQLLQWALKDFPADQVEAENKRLNKARELLKVQMTGLQAQINASQNAVANVPQLEKFIQTIQGKLSNLDFESKLQALDMLEITVWLDGENVDMTGNISPEDINKNSCIVFTTSGCLLSGK
jgi:site-specific DNA recombinase